MPPSSHRRQPASRSRRPLALGAATLLLAGGIFGIVHVINGPGSPADDLPAGAAARSPLKVLRVTPAPDATGVSFDKRLVVTFSRPLSPESPLPSLSPTVPGRWAPDGPDQLTFTPRGYLPPATGFRLTVPAGDSGVRDTDGDTLDTPFSSTFTVASPSQLRLQQLLAELDYLPVAFTAEPPVKNDLSDVSGASGASGGAAASTETATSPSEVSALDAEPTLPSAIPLTAQPGSFTDRFASLPTQLAAAWQPGGWNLVTKGAVMAFQADHNLKIDAEPGPLFWHELLAAVANRALDGKPYSYILVSETYPETLYLWSDGRVILQSPANTGVAAAPTPLGTWPVYLRYTSTTMKGTNPDGSHYSDPGVPWVAYFNGSDAVHGFPRSGYGFQQSVGCVELPISTAAQVFPYDGYGTLVTVTTGDLTPELHAAPPSVISPPPAPATTTTPAPTTTTPAPTTTTPAPPKPKPTTTTATTLPPTTAPTTSLAPPPST